MTDADYFPPHSADATIASQATGAMSWAFITALQKNPNPTYIELLNDIRDLLETNYSQKPQLSCSHPLGMFHALDRASMNFNSRIDTDIQFVM